MWYGVKFHKNCLVLLHNMEDFIRKRSWGDQLSSYGIKHEGPRSKWRLRRAEGGRRIVQGTPIPQTPDRTALVDLFLPLLGPPLGAVVVRINRSSSESDGRATTSMVPWLPKSAPWTQMEHGSDGGDGCHSVREKP